ncbi:plant UBX domain-containing protein 11-like [Zingiber officinale]|nr:plant UBX domain-containing protein 11-like [Zingiber officinale]
MERSTLSLAFKRSIAEAINESRKQKKLFMVYISGDDENSVKMDEETWLDQRVGESISKCCILLHLTAGSVDASQFSAIYPQRATPSITAIGLNGVMLWHHVGYITTENLITNIDKAWAALQMQEAALTLLTVALSSKEPDTLNNVPSSSVVPSGQLTSGESNVPSTSSDKPTDKSESKTPTDYQQLKENTLVGETSSQADSIAAVKTRNVDCLSSEDLHSLKNINSTTSDLGENNFPILNTTVDNSQAAAFSEPDGNDTILCSIPSQVATEAQETTTQVKKIDFYSGLSNPVKSNDIHLNIRMPTGNNLQTKLTINDTLNSVKIFVDENLDNVLSLYDLAVPYPRRLFNNEDMQRTLSELGFASRQALIVVPRNQATQPHRVQLSMNMTTSNDSNRGYFDYVKRVLSYVNPFSYLGGNNSSSNSETLARTDGPWQHSSNPALQNHSLDSDNRNTARDSSASSSARPRPARQFGSNIHTLRHDGDSSSDKNVFWNGNSTQFGGDDKK